MELCSENKASAHYNCRGERPHLLDSTVVFHHSRSVRSVLKAYPDGSRSLRVLKQSVNPLARCPRRIVKAEAEKRLSALNVDKYFVPDEVLEYLELFPEGCIDVAGSNVALKKNVHKRDVKAVEIVCDIARSNFWNYFVTFTLNPEKVDRESYKQCLGIVTKWLNHLRAKDEQLRYLMVSELHKKGGYHFHCLAYLSDTSILVDSGHKDIKTGKTIYNIPSFTSGFTTALECDNSPAVWRYLSKYITKGSGHSYKSLGRHRFYASRNCVRPSRYVFYDPIEPLSDMVKLWDNMVSVGYESPAVVQLSEGGADDETSC